MPSDGNSPVTTRSMVRSEFRRRPTRFEEELTVHSVSKNCCTCSPNQSSRGPSTHRKVAVVVPDSYWLTRNGLMSRPSVMPLERGRTPRVSPYFAVAGHGVAWPCDVCEWVLESAFMLSRMAMYLHMRYEGGSIRKVLAGACSTGRASCSCMCLR